MTIEMWSGLVGVVLPALVAIVNREDWASWKKALVALGSSVLAGTVTVLIAGDLTGADWVTSIGIVFGAAMATYKLWWKGSGISDMIEQKVNVIVSKGDTTGGAHREPPATPAE